MNGSRQGSASADSLRSRLLAHAAELGFAGCGIVGVDDLPASPDAVGFFKEWVKAGYHGEMGYLAGPGADTRRDDLALSLESVRSVVVVSHDYGGEEEAITPDRGVIARYARGRDYHKVLKKRLQSLGRWLIDEARNQGQEVRVYVDTGPLLERHLAWSAGLGWVGKNTMLIHPSRGSYAFLGVLLTDVELEPTQTPVPDRCGSCSQCLDACPTGALLGRDESGAPVMDARRCISYLTIEYKGVIPTDLRRGIGNRIFGCDICQEVCPWNQRFAGEGDPSYAARGPGELPVGVEPVGADAPDDHVEVTHPGTDRPELTNLMGMDDGGWDAFSRGSPIRRAGRNGFLRNVAVALGNWGSPDAVPVLADALIQEEPLVQIHAAWALGEIGGEAARRALEDSQPAGLEEGVVEAIEAALAEIQSTDS